MIYIRTYAYNAEKTLKRAVDSILNQTYKEFTYYLCDNGSTDATQEMVAEYAKKDSRIKAFRNNVNRGYHETEECLFLAYNIGDEDLYGVLDADDEYTPEFFETMVKFMQQNNLDIVACGSDFINTQTGQLTSRREVPQNLILEGKGFGIYFPVYYQFARTTWGKLSKGRTLRETVQDSNDLSFLRAYGSDTYNTLISFRSAAKVGILAGTLHKYYMSPKSVSYRWIPGRMETDRILYDMAREFLTGKVGSVSPKNEDVLRNVYFYAIKDTLRVLVNARLAVTEKIQHIKDIFTYKTTKELFSYGYMHEESSEILKWVFAQKESRKPDVLKIIAEIVEPVIDAGLLQLLTPENLAFAVSKMPEILGHFLKKDYNLVLDRLKAWYKRHDSDDPLFTELEIAMNRALNKPDSDIFLLLIEIRKKRPLSSKKLGIDAQIGSLIEKYPQLQNVSAKLASHLPQAVLSVMQGNFQQALKRFISDSQGMEISDGETEAYFTLGQNLAAAANKADIYVYFKKMWISYLQDCSRDEEARQKTAELEQLSLDDR